MKPLLRTLLAVDAIVVLLLGLLFLASPWLVRSDLLAGFASTPAVFGQLFGVVLLGLAWMQGSAARNPALTAPVARIVGNTLGVAALVFLVWLIALGVPVLPVRAQRLAIVLAVGLLLLGLVQARMGITVMKRERLQAVGAVSAARAEARARVDGDPYIGTPPTAVSRDATEARFTGGPGTIDPLSPAAAAVSGAHREPRIVTADIDAAERRERERRTDVPPAF
ncbi:hypothetical protein OVY01_03320 [Robbsia sp. Bb-Pol-6]|uniref:Transmembrane protein n=1 Tax=Robbsia betulipollinis TaxID=2981849 RepID=A0ABT3ZID5_9BURK|nr:hypothetical protein [Robbsia betulipollinis]MCY0386290.1 hypothetical protein [Robbsia betulipollinis]